MNCHPRMSCLSSVRGSTKNNPHSLNNNINNILSNSWSANSTTKVVGSPLLKLTGLSHPNYAENDNTLTFSSSPPYCHPRVSIAQLWGSTENNSHSLNNSNINNVGTGGSPVFAEDESTSHLSPYLFLVYSLLCGIFACAFLS